MCVCGASSPFCLCFVRTVWGRHLNYASLTVKIPEIICVKINAHIATKEAFEPNLFSNAASHACFSTQRRCFRIINKHPPTPCDTPWIWFHAHKHAHPTKSSRRERTRCYIFGACLWTYILSCFGVRRVVDINFDKGASFLYFHI